MAIDDRQQIKSETREMRLLDEALATEHVIFKNEYTCFKIAPVDSGGIAAGTTITLLIDGRSVVLNDDQALTMTFPDEDFIWLVETFVGVSRLSLAFAGAATADVIFQVTGYRRIEPDRSVDQAPAAVSATIEVFGNSQAITNGDTTPAVADDTDYGSTPALTPVTHIFTIENNGDGNLSDLVVTAPAGFTVTVQPAANVGPLGSTTFSVRFDALLAQVYDGNVTIASHLGSFIFAIIAEGL